MRKDSPLIVSAVWGMLFLLGGEVLLGAAPKKIRKGDRKEERVVGEKVKLVLVKRAMVEKCLSIGVDFHTLQCFRVYWSARTVQE